MLEKVTICCEVTWLECGMHHHQIGLLQEMKNRKSRLKTKVEIEIFKFSMYQTDLWLERGDEKWEAQGIDK